MKDYHPTPSKIKKIPEDLDPDEYNKIKWRRFYLRERYARNRAKILEYMKRHHVKKEKKPSKAIPQKVHALNHYYRNREEILRKRREKRIKKKEEEKVNPPVVNPVVNPPPVVNQ